MSLFEYDDNPKSPRPARSQRKHEGVKERGEARKDDDRDYDRHVHVRC
jgi:hypothetical protein